MKLEITPQPSDQERAAIAAALAEELEEAASAWPQTVFPQRLDDGEE